MAVESFVQGVEGFNIGLSEVVSALSTLPGFSMLVRLAQVAGILVIVYLAFLLLRGILGLRRAFQLKRIVIAIEEINHKMSKLTGVSGRKPVKETEVKTESARKKKGKKSKKSKR
tara:strand:+ start:293 stop:637 length:345 start_codon:yes stop_codon:yes gene_type:complete